MGQVLSYSQLISLSQSHLTLHVFQFIIQCVPKKGYLLKSRANASCSNLTALTPKWPENGRESQNKQKSLLACCMIYYNSHVFFDCGRPVLFINNLNKGRLRPNAITQRDAIFMFSN